MAYVRILKHYLHIPYLVLGVIEFGLLVLAVFMGVSLATGVPVLNAIPEGLWMPALIFAGVLSCTTLSMGVYIALIGEGFSSMVLRTLVSFCLLGSIALWLLYFIFPGLALSQNALFWSVVLATLLVFIVRWLFRLGIDIRQLQRRVVIFGAGHRAQEVLGLMPKKESVSGVRIVGCIHSGVEQVQVKDEVFELPTDWHEWVRREDISEIVVALDERRRSEGGHFPLQEFLSCKLRGVQISDSLSFCERELSKIDIDNLRPSWMVYSDGFRFSKSRDIAKRAFDLFVSLLLALVLWPFMLATALAVFLESGRPILYWQERVGYQGKTFRIYKFRSMTQDAEKGGKAVWATKNDARVTKVGAFIRNTRLDELPQLYNVIKGDMSFVGPRPERPEFVKDLEEKIPFYSTRHQVKPGLMGWAQLKYPYGASVEDAKNKLEYDLYYTKNHSFLMDMLILIQTVEVVLLGKGVH